MVRVSVLGPLEVTDAVGRPVRVGGQRVRALLILLAMDAGRVVSARSLIERLWPDERPGDAANALQSLVSRLRVALRPSATRMAHDDVGRPAASGLPRCAGHGAGRAGRVRSIKSDFEFSLVGTPVRTDIGTSIAFTWKIIAIRSAPGRRRHGRQ
jgi:hypothetical protein